MTHVRPATAGDATALAALRWEFRSRLGAAVETESAFIERCTVWMRRELEKGDWRAWVAVRNEAIAGQLWLRVIDKLPNPVGERDRHAYISNVYVRPSERGGVGARLVETAVSWATANGIDRVVLWPTAKSVHLYERHGFVHRGDVMEKKCPPA
jgi:GNAT superfamily N-acetyltransferase